MKYILLAFTLAIVCTTSAHAQSTKSYAVGGRMICALNDSGALNCATDNASTRLQPPSTTPVLTSIAAGDVHVCGLTESGSAYCWGDNDFGQLNAPQDEQFLSISAGINFSCGVTTDGRALCWGLDTQGDAEPPSDQRFLQLALDANSSCGLKLNNELSCWGQYDLATQLNEQETFTKIALKDNNLCGLTETSSILCNFESLAPSGTNMIDVAMTGDLVCGLQSTGELSCRSNNSNQDWQQYLDGKIADINNGAEVVALYGGGGYFTKICYSTADDGFDCFGRENSGEPLLPDSGLPMLDAPLDLSADVYSDSTVELSWRITTDINNVFTLAGADIYRDGALLTSTTNRNSFIDDTLTPGVDYEYSVALYMSTGERGAQSPPITVNSDRDSSGMGSDYTPVNRALTPTGLRAVNYSAKDLELFWDRPTSLPVNFNGYEIWRNHVFHAFTPGTSFYDNSVTPGSSYHYDVLAVSQDGSILGFNGVSVETSDN
ncbi:hypothetical protein [Granulosicoccus antarcticus]|uniref:non-specific serine/threonine protein kinase n=1 Tax=Granulosicoccus antarcticus IMCC3135 TaxID=1192854 RepID=A0A2Z2NR38_9GAMM|nr:hypothetical protein [Granulosicoccus antarcticus]ASJ72188.1 Exoglucanase B [Granulosicoccus antarcticus IMCC3135]